jgi:ADP-ribose pyrophosphatase
VTVEPWERLDERSAYSSRWIDLRVERCRLPDGAVVDDYHVQHHPNWVAAVAVTGEGRFVLVRQWREAAKVTSLEFAGGVIDAGEAPAAAAARELLEETGFRGEAGVDLGWCWTNPASHTNRIHAVLIEGARRVQDPTFDAHEDLEVEEVDAARLLDLLRSGEFAHGLHAALAHRVRLHRPDLFGDAR